MLKLTPVSVASYVKHAQRSYENNVICLSREQLCWVETTHDPRSLHDKHMVGQRSHILGSFLSVHMLGQT